jgi:phospho-N-acetylmuramoyl-pentapeptide-transferase
MGNKMNEEFIRIHGHKTGTPTMGGLMISVTVFVLVLFGFPQTPLRDVFLIGWGLFTLYGLVEGLMVFARKVDEKFKLFQESFGWRVGKLVVLFLLGVFVTWLIQSRLGVESITLVPNLITIPLTAVTIPFFAFAMVMAMYGMEITDGLDGLVTGKFLIALGAYLLIVLISGRLELLPYLALAVGSSLVYLYFNINPARVFMGGTGTLPIGFLLILTAVLTNSVYALIILGVMFWVELASSFIQIISIRFFKRKIFRIAPIHHHFEAIGWPETKVVQRFWLVAAVAAVVAIWVYTSVAK